MKTHCRLILFCLGSKPCLDIFLRDVRLLVPDVVFCRLINLGKILLGWLELSRRLLGSITRDIT
jgi:hypothetical protein